MFADHHLGFEMSLILLVNFPIKRDCVRCICISWMTSCKMRGRWKVAVFVFTAHLPPLSTAPPPSPTYHPPAHFATAPYSSSYTHTGALVLLRNSTRYKHTHIATGWDEGVKKQGLHQNGGVGGYGMVW